jgi:hypothetical protein
MPATGVCALTLPQRRPAHVATQGGTSSDSGVDTALIRCTTRSSALSGPRRNECHAGARAVDDLDLHGAYVQIDLHRYVDRLEPHDAVRACEALLGGSFISIALCLARTLAPEGERVLISEVRR